MNVSNLDTFRIYLWLTLWLTIRSEGILYNGQRELLVAPFIQPLGKASHFSGCADLKGFFFGGVALLSMLPKRTAILVDGGYYRVRSADLWGKKSANDRANELYKYCMLHITEPEEPRELYRIFYYDCPPMTRTLRHPLTGAEVDYANYARNKDGQIILQIFV